MITKPHNIKPFWIVLLLIVVSPASQATPSDNYVSTLHDYILSVITEYMDTHPTSNSSSSSSVIVNVSTSEYSGVVAYGAIGDGITDDTTAIQNAIDAAEAQNTAVYFPSGKYLVSDTLTISKAIRVYGDGDSSQVYQSSDKNLFYVYDVNHMTIEDLFLGSSATSQNTALIYLNATHGSYLKDLRLQGAKIGIYLHGSILNNIDNLVVSTNVINSDFYHPTTSILNMKAAVYEDTYNGIQPNANIINNPRIESGEYGVYVNDAVTGQIIGGTIEGMDTGAGTGVLLNNVGVYTINSLYSEANKIDVRLISSAGVNFFNAYLESHNSINFSSDSIAQLYGGQIGTLNGEPGGQITVFGTSITVARNGGLYHGMDQYGEFYQDRDTRFMICKKPDATLYAC